MHAYFLPVWILGAPFVLAVLDLINTRSAMRRGERATAHAY